MQAQAEAMASEIRAFARGYASAVEAHCLSLLRRLEELRVQRRFKKIKQRIKVFFGTPPPPPLGSVAERFSILTWYSHSSALQEPPPSAGGAAAADPVGRPRRCGVCRATSQLWFRH